MSARRKQNLAAGLAVAACLVAGGGTALAAPPATSALVAITGATVHTMGSAGTLENATVLLENGRIRAILGPIGPQWCSDELLQAATEVSLTRGVPLHMHALESKLRQYPGEDDLATGEDWL